MSGIAEIEQKVSELRKLMFEVLGHDPSILKIGVSYQAFDTLMFLRHQSIVSPMTIDDREYVGAIASFRATDSFHLTLAGVEVKPTKESSF